jgi:hypothetical protein
LAVIENFEILNNNEVITIKNLLPHRHILRFVKFWLFVEADSHRNDFRIYQTPKRENEAAGG